jgi:CysZ protein
MFSALTLAFGEILDPRLRRALMLSLLGAVLVLAGLAFGLGVAVHAAATFDSWLLDRALELLGGFAILALVWLLFPAVVTLVLGFFLEGAIAAVEARRYPGLPPARRQGPGEMIRAGVRLTLFSIAINLIALPLYLLLPGVNLVVFYGLNGWLLGREYFELIALRRLDQRQLRVVWRTHRGLLVASGAIIAVLLTLPLVNLAAPLIAALFMLHLFQRLQQRDSVALASR